MKALKGHQSHPHLERTGTPNGGARGAGDGALGERGGVAVEDLAVSMVDEHGRALAA